MKKQAKKAKAEANTAASPTVKIEPKGNATRKSGQMTESRIALLATAKFKKAHADAITARVERKKSTMCPAGKHDLRKPEHVHSGFLLREHGLLCRTCWVEKYQGKKAKAKK